MSWCREFWDREGSDLTHLAVESSTSAEEGGVRSSVVISAVRFTFAVLLAGTFSSSSSFFFLVDSDSEVSLELCASVRG